VKREEGHESDGADAEACEADEGHAKTVYSFQITVRSS
jgi:hypothetical protein